MADLDIFYSCKTKWGRALTIDRKSAGERSAAMAASAMQFYHHAISRIDVYTRHLSSYPTEAVHGFMLMSTAARVRASMSKSLSKLPDRSEPDAIANLKLSNQYLASAWPKLVSLGLPRALARRFFLERFKTYAKLANSKLADEREGNYIRRMKLRDRHTLEGLAQGSDYWKRLLAKLRSDP